MSRWNDQRSLIRSVISDVWQESRNDAQERVRLVNPSTTHTTHTHTFTLKFATRPFHVEFLGRPSPLPQGDHNHRKVPTISYMHHPSAYIQVEGSSYILIRSMNPNKPLISTHLLPFLSRYLSTTSVNAVNPTWFAVVNADTSSARQLCLEPRRWDDAPNRQVPFADATAFSPSNRCL